MAARARDRRAESRGGGSGGRQQQGLGAPQAARRSGPAPSGAVGGWHGSPCQPARGTQLRHPEMRWQAAWLTSEAGSAG